MALGRPPDRGFSRTSQHQYLRRSTSLDHAEIPGLYRTLIPEYDQIPAVAAVPSDDAGPRDAFPVGCRRQNAAIPPAGARHRQGAVVLLLSARAVHPSARSSRVTRAMERCTGCSSHRASTGFRSLRRPDGDSLCRLSIWCGLSSYSGSIRFAAGLQP